MFTKNRKLPTTKLETRYDDNSHMGIYVNTSHNLKTIDSALRWGIVQNSPIDAATSVIDLLGGYPAGRIRLDGIYWVNN